MVGDWSSVTFTVNLQVPPPDSLQVTVVVPTGKAEPEAGLHVNVPQSPVVVGAGKVTTAAHASGSLGLVMSAGHVITQGCAGMVTQLENSEVSSVMLSVAVAVMFLPPATATGRTTVKITLQVGEAAVGPTT